MFCVVYEFDVIPEKENEFKTLWHAITLDIRAAHNGLGSRLHKVIDKENKWVGYAQWPSREQWLKHRELIFNPSPPEWVKALQATCHSVSVLLELELVDDLLSNENAKLKPHHL